MFVDFVGHSNQRIYIPTKEENYSYPSNGSTVFGIANSPMVSKEPKIEPYQ
jgi:hypothetical protein